MKLNLARRPFVNLRPITRLALVAWLLGALLAAWNLRQAWTLWRGLGAERELVAEAQRALGAERERLREVENALRGIDLMTENAHALFLDQEIDRRVFSWTHLFESLGRVLPREVRLVQVSPLLVAPGQPRGRGARKAEAAAGELWVTVQVTGYAERDEALLDLVDALFAAPEFAAPDLRREAVPPGKPVQFELAVSYLPPAAAAPPEGAPGRAETAPAAPPPTVAAAIGITPEVAAPEAGSAVALPPVSRTATAGDGEESLPGGAEPPVGRREREPRTPAPDERSQAATPAAAPRVGGRQPAPPAGEAGIPMVIGVPAAGASGQDTPPAAAPVRPPVMRPRKAAEGAAPGVAPVPLGAPASATRRIGP